ALLTFRPPPTAFRRDDLRLVDRLTGLASQALRASDLAKENTLLAATIAGSSSGFAISDATNDRQPIIYVNEAFERITGYEAADVLGQNCRMLTAEDPDAPERARLRAAVAARDGGTFLLRNRRKSGAQFWNELTLSPVKDAAGQVTNLVATQTDVTARVEAAAERDQVRGRMERALAATADAFLVLDQDGTVAFSNSAVDGIFTAPALGWAPGTTFTENWRAFIAAEDAAGRRVSSLVRGAAVDTLAQMDQALEIRLPDGCDVLLRASRLPDGGLVLSATDVTPLKDAQRLLSDRLAAIEAATDGIAIEDAEGRLTYLNPAALRNLSYAQPEAAIGTPWRDRYADAPKLARRRAFEATVRRAGPAPQTHEITGAPLDTGGSVIVIRDVTDTLATAEREENLTRELIRLQRQEAIAQLTAGIAHDFNNVLAAINGSLAVMEMHPELPAGLHPHLDRISTAGTQSAKLISKLLDVGADTEGEGDFPLAPALTDLPKLTGASLPDHITLDVPDTPPPLVLKGQPGTLSQILINLVLNARDALGDRPGRIALSVDEVATQTAQEAQVGRRAAGARYAKITVTDTGPGMTADVAAQVFQPYFTTKGRQGTGLGLATAALQVKSVGGAMDVASAPDQGTTFTLHWPLARARPQPDQLADTDGDGADLSGLTILVVDDDANVGEAVGAYLRALGADVGFCEDPRDAAEAIEEDPDAWSALVTDYDMPHMNGGALAARAGQAAPDLPILVVTALAKRLNDPRLTTPQVKGLFAKPIALTALAKALATHGRKP
ncbi:MAG: PAS domain-containing protein, partial [Pseudomonadota bacterium]